MPQEVATRGPQTERLASEKIVVAAPMSFAGSAQRTWKMTRRDNPWERAVFVMIALCIIAAWWCVIVGWYLVFGLLLIPYRILRRGSRKRKREELRHREMMAAVERQKQG